MQDMHPFFQPSASPFIAKSLLRAVSGRAGRKCPRVHCQNHSRRQPSSRLTESQVLWMGSMELWSHGSGGRKEGAHGGSVSAAHWKSIHAAEPDLPVCRAHTCPQSCPETHLGCWSSKVLLQLPQEVHLLSSVGKAPSWSFSCLWRATPTGS